MQRLSLTFLLISGLAFGQEIEGRWQGAIEAGAMKLRINVEFASSAGQLTGKLQSPDQSPAWINADSASFSGGAVKFAIKMIGGSYEGTLDKDEIRGQWSQGGGSLPLVLKRAPAGQPKPAAASKGTPLTAEERKILVDHLKRTRQAFLDEITGLSEAQWNFKPGPDRWSIAECAEHLALEEDFILKLVTDQIMKLEPREGVRNGRAQDDEIVKAMLDRTKKASAAEPMRPAGKPLSAEAVTKRFTEARDRSVEFANSTQDDLRSHSVPHPVFKFMDGYQYLLMMSAHTERHLAQMREVKAAAEYPKPPMVSHAPLSGMADKGVFLLYMNEERIGSVEADLRADGSMDGTVNVATAGQKVTTRTHVLTDRDGQITSVEMELPTGNMTATREGGTLRLKFKEKTTITQIKPGARVYTNLPPVLAQAVRMYDEAKGGKQTFPLLTLPGTMVDSSLERKDEVERTAGGKDLRYKRYVLTLPGVDLIVWASQQGKIDCVEVPQQHVAFVREGYEALRKEPKADASVSQPQFDVAVDAGTKVPMRDKVRLSADIYRPKAEGKFPVILIRTPYKKEMVELQARYYSRRGYVVAVEDCRGRFGSEGTWEPFVNEPKDGYDTIEWLAAQPWSNGKVGMIGGSYVGWVQWWAASQKPPHLVTIIPNVAPPDPFYNIPYEYGVFFAWGSIWWADVLESQATADLSGATISKIFEKKYGKLMKDLPVIDLDRRILGRENPYWRTWIEHPNNDSYWDRANFLDKLKDVRIPVFHQSGWFDGDGIGTKLNYLRMASYGHPNQKLVIGPWGHTDSSARGIGDRDFGADAITDLQRDYLRWFDRWLKGSSNAIEKEPLVRLFVMGSNQWLTGDKYPLPQTQFRKLYLASGGNANTSKGDGKLTFDPPAAGSPPDKYVYDPGDPTPDPRWYETSEEEDKIVKTQDQRKKDAEEYHRQRLLRKDILVYETEVLAKPLTFAGPVSAVLYAASSARDTDWFVTLHEIDKNGKPFGLGQGKIRARFRKSMSKPEFLTPGAVNEYTLDLWHTGITIPAGHKLRIEVASASFPLFSRNLNTGGNNEVETKFVSAGQTIYHDAKYPSHLLLPVIGMEAK